MPTLRYGHAPGHIREAFLNAIEEFMAWNDGEPEPTVDVEFDYVPNTTPISAVCGLLWNCTDILPGSVYRDLRDGAQIELRRQTYAAAAQGMRAVILSLSRQAQEVSNG